MALLPSAASASLRNQFTIASYEAGSGGTVYTVPDGKNFVGYFWMQRPNSSGYTTILVNGSGIFLGANTTYGTWYAFPLYLTAGDVVSNNSSEYFTITGYEE